MKPVDVTLYDVFGYFLPGCVALIAVYPVAAKVGLSVNQDWSTVSTLSWMVVGGVAYVMGHALQGLSNALYRLVWSNPEQRVLENAAEVPPQLVRIAKKTARELGHLHEIDEIETKTLYEVMDNYNQQHGNTTNRDMYIYREGFYRGLSVGFLLLAISLVAAMTDGQTPVSAFGGSLVLTQPSMRFVAAMAITMAVIAALRYRRFATYRVKNCLFSFLTLRDLSKNGGSPC